MSLVDPSETSSQPTVTRRKIIHLLSDFSMLFKTASFAAWLSLLSSAAAAPSPEEVTVATATAGIPYNTTYVSLLLVPVPIDP